MGRGKSKAIKEKILEDDLKKVKFMLFNNTDFRTFSGKIELGVKADEQSESSEMDEKFTQEDIIKTILRKQDSLTVLPTGGGKSYCFQGPSFCFSGITLVITPLVALMHDQVKNFNRMCKKLYNRYVNEEEGIVGSEYYHGELYRAIYPGMNNLSLKGFFDEIVHPQDWDEWDTDHKVQYKMIYVSPERLSNPKFLREFKKREENGEIQVDFVVVDEAHCMSQWGFDFRESYLAIGNFIERLKKRPVIAAFSATVTRRDRQQIAALLKFPKEAPHFLCYEGRDNLNLVSVLCDDSKSQESGLGSRMYELIKILRSKKNREKKCIIYCTSVKAVESLYDLFMKGKFVKYQFLPAKYHGQMSDSQKKMNLERFVFQKTFKIKDRKMPPTNIMIATKAFGMGIDCDDIEIVIHYNVPRCLEDYYQEVGRAGRSKKIKADCYLLYSDTSMRTTINRALTEALSEEMEKQFIASRFSNKMRKSIRFHSFYRLAKMWEYCNNNKVQGQNYIMEYFTQSKIDIRLVEKFYRYLEKYFFAKEKSAKVNPIQLLIQKSYTFDKKYVVLLNDIKYQNELTKELIHIIGHVNCIHINNTRIANYLRWYSERYDIKLDEYNRPIPISIPIKEWKRKEDNIPDVRNALMRTDISEDAAFIHMMCPQMDVSKYVVPMWKRYCKDKSFSIEVMFVVNQKTNLVERILRKLEDEWIDISEEDSLRPMLNKDVGGLFPKERYSDWYKRKDIFALVSGKREREVSFAFRVDPKAGVDESHYNEYKLDYFDLCVADAIYSIEVNGNSRIYLKTIWEVLSGDTQNVFSRSDSKIKKAIEKSIDKMQHLRITIQDGDFPDEIYDEVFLPIKRLEGEGERGYFYEQIPPLYRYAEEINGELIKVPVALLNGSKISKLLEQLPEFC